MEQKDVQDLIRKYQDGTCNEAERQQLEMHLLRYLGREGSIPSEDLLERAATNNFNAIMAAISRKTIKDMPTHKKFVFRYGWYAAALFSVVLAISLYFYPGLIADRSPKIINDIVPGGNRATLTLVDGTKVSLDSAQSGIIVSNEGIKYQNGKLLPGVILEAGGSYKSGGGRSVSQSPAGRQAGTDGGEVLLQLKTPRGGQYQIILSDGTKVWLNAQSTLKYPSRFSGDTRTVKLEGEAFFEVKEDKTKSFKVLSNNQSIEVLGTSFNLTAYANELSARTTLVTGTVRVSTPDASLQLIPGEQSVLVNNAISKQKINFNDAIAWKNGKFSWEGKSFAQIMNELARWYDIDIKYDGSVPQLSLYGDAKRNNKLSFVLHMLESVHVSYTLQGRTLIIHHKKGGNP